VLQFFGVMTRNDTGSSLVLFFFFFQRPALLVRRDVGGRIGRPYVVNSGELGKGEGDRAGTGSNAPLRELETLASRTDNVGRYSSGRPIVYREPKSITWWLCATG
jgi:hypothetical protein